MRVQLNGMVTCDEDAPFYRWWGMNAFSPADVRRAIAANPQGEELVLEINSTGGDVFSGFEIYSVLRSANCPTRSEVQSLAASAASTMMLGADTVAISPVAQVMIHLPSTVTIGDQPEHYGSIRTLDSITASIVDAYALKCGGRTTRDHLMELVEASSWLTAQEALELGLVDEIMYTEGEALTPQIVNAVGGAMRSLTTRSGDEADIGVIRAAYRAAHPEGGTPEAKLPAPETGPEGAKTPQNCVPAGKVPAENSAAQAATARLALEKIRFGGI